MNTYRPDCVIDGQTGILANSDGELAEGLELLLTNRELRLKMAHASVTVAQKFDWDRISEKWADLFCQIVADRRKLLYPRRGASNDIHVQRN
jgi:glycosyltransferase involved in cell wall biosynthesis